MLEVVPLARLDKTKRIKELPPPSVAVELLANLNKPNNNQHNNNLPSVHLDSKPAEPLVALAQTRLISPLLPLEALLPQVVSLSINQIFTRS